MVIVGEFADGFNVSASSAESSEDFSNVSIFLHGDDSKLIFFIAPDEEVLLVVMEDTSARWPVSVHVGGSKESVSFPIDLKVKFSMFFNKDLNTKRIKFIISTYLKR